MVLSIVSPGGDFLMSKVKDPASGKVFFSTTRDGKGIKMQRTFYAEVRTSLVIRKRYTKNPSIYFFQVFYVMAMAGLARVTGLEKYKKEATETMR